MASAEFLPSAGRRLALSAGEVTLPCRFRKVHYSVALFPVAKSAVEASLTGSGLIPALRWGGRRMVALGLVSYADSDLGAYEEAILAVPVVPEGRPMPFSPWLDLVGPLPSRVVGMRILHIPVTSEFSRMAGNEVWGYPKIVTGIVHRFAPGRVDSKVSDPEGRSILRCRGRLGLRIPSIPLSLVTYSELGGRRVRTEVRVRGAMRLWLGHSLRLEVGDSKHPMAEELRRFGLDGRRPVVFMDSPAFQAEFGEARPC